MATYAFSFTAASTDVGTWQEIPLDPSPGNYAQPTLGDQAIAFSATYSADAGTATSTLQVAWVQGTNSTSTVGVTQTEDIVLTPSTTRKPNLANGGTGWVCSASCASTSNNTMRVVGIGTITKDNRVSPTVDITGTSRRLYLGLKTLGASSGTITVYVTTSRII
jgi:hypothetical protein